MTTMRALRFASYGPPSVLSFDELDVPTIEPGEVLVEVHAAAINPSDVKIVGGVFTPTLPRTPGRDFAGVVVDGDTRVGQAVWGSGAGFGVTRDGAHAQFVAIPATWLSEKPETLSMEQAATVGVPFVTAWTALVRVANVQHGETVLITGAAGAVGRAATQIAHWKQATVIGAGREVVAPSVDVYVDMRTKDLAAEVRAVTAGKGVDVAIDTVGGPVFEPAIKSLGLDGRQVVITSVGQRRVEFDLMDFYHNRQRLLGVDTAKHTGAEIAQIMTELRPGFEAGVLKPSALKTWPLARGVEAYMAVASGDHSAKHVLLPRQG